MGVGRCSAADGLLFRRILDIPFETCVAALESWSAGGRDGELRFGRSNVLGPVEHVRDRGACRFDVRLARGRLRPLLRMRLDIGRWTGPSARTALELIPAQRVRPTVAYFRAGHRLLDAMTQALSQHIAQPHPGDEQRFSPPVSAATARTASAGPRASRG
ncbi:MAG TPA: hypothetical protein VH480_08470 [Streptosporangiaceae bacterium]|jgi:hypothetical protein